MSIQELLISLWRAFRFHQRETFQASMSDSFAPNSPSDHTLKHFDGKMTRDSPEEASYCAQTRRQT